MSRHDIPYIVNRQREFFNSGITLPLSFRLNSLASLYTALKKSEPEILSVLYKDLGKSAGEAYLTELGLVLEELRFVQKYLRRWARPFKVRSPLYAQFSQGRVYTEPYGVTLNISPWNYPFQLALMPLISAIAAGNCMILKPSSKTPHTSRLLEQIITSVFDPGMAYVVSGGAEAGNALLAERFDFILYTGSSRVAKSVMRAASANLTPVCLELGGKSPALVFADAKLEYTAKVLAWGKLVNAGQTCIAPDYILAHHSIKDQLAGLIQAEFDRFPGPDACNNPEYGRIISPNAMSRLLALSENRATANMETMRMAPMLIPDANLDSPLMQEEIFGPLFPVLSFNNTHEVVQFVNNREKALACYIFTEDKRLAQSVIGRVPFGGGCVNDTLMHLTNPRLPFGGVGYSGMGRYHGEHGFRLFSNQKGVLHKKSWPDFSLRYPPYTDSKLMLLKKLFK